MPLHIHDFGLLQYSSLSRQELIYTYCMVVTADVSTNVKYSYCKIYKLIYLFDPADGLGGGAWNLFYDNFSQGWRDESPRPGSATGHTWWRVVHGGWFTRANVCL